MHSTRYACQRPRWIQANYTISFVCGSTTLGKAAIITVATADSTLKTSRAVPHPSTNRALCRLPSEVEKDPVRSSRYGRHGMPVRDQHAYRSDHAISFVFGVTTLGKAPITTMATADSIIGSVVPQVQANSPRDTRQITQRFNVARTKMNALPGRLELPTLRCKASRSYQLS